MKNAQIPAYSYVVHDFYGCESGCDGHRFYLCDEHDNIIESKFEFTHPYGEDFAKWAEQMRRGQWDVPVRLDLCKVVD